MLLRYDERGFTLIEVLIVVFILGVLTAIIYPNMSSMVGVSDLVAANSEADTFRKAAQAYSAQHDNVWPEGTYGPAEGGLGVLDDYIEKQLKGNYSVSSDGAVVGTGGWPGLTWQTDNDTWVKEP